MKISAIIAEAAQRGVTVTRTFGNIHRFRRAGVLLSWCTPTQEGRWECVSQSGRKMVTNFSLRTRAAAYHWCLGHAANGDLV